MVSPTNSKLITSSDGLLIYADSAGSPDKPGIVFIHGLAVSGIVFNDIFANEQYTRDFYLVRYDMRGHGQSGKPDSIDGYASKLYADDFAEVMKAFGLRKPVVVGWSVLFSSLSTVIADIAAHLPASTLSGAVYLSALPYIGPIMQRVGTPLILGMLPGLLNKEDTTVYVKTAHAFADSLFLKPSAVPWETRCLWLGMTACQLPTHRSFALSRPQDPTKLHELGRNGFPLLVLNGTKDSQVDGDAVVEEMKPYFKEMEVYVVEDGSHASFYESEQEVMGKIMEFVRKVQIEVRSSDLACE
ncbi:alpha/beta-hydrolase [Phellopilus nigrolimitatus]|nr:alpha/beta-hydrolase [Phellopilus nigrolimitatus]